VILHHSSEALGSDATMSANVSEYTAVKHALRWLIANGHRLHALKVHSDSQLVMFQLSGKYNVHVERLKGLRDHVRQLAKLFPQVTYHWIPREQNRYADFMSKTLHGGGSVPPVPVPPEIIASHR
jgi:ribonuclease HI